MLKAYRRRVEEVRVTIPADRLLVFAVTEGWTPLCRFLGVPVPAVPFPRANNTEQFWEVVNGPPAEATRATAPAALPAAAAHVVSAG